MPINFADAVLRKRGLGGLVERTLRLSRPGAQLQQLISEAVAEEKKKFERRFARGRPRRVARETRKDSRSAVW